MTPRALVLSIVLALVAAVLGARTALDGRASDEVAADTYEPYADYGVQLDDPRISDKAGIVAPFGPRAQPLRRREAQHEQSHGADRERHADERGNRRERPRRYQRLLALSGRNQRVAAGESTPFNKAWGVTVETGHEHVRYRERHAVTADKSSRVLTFAKSSGRSNITFRAPIRSRSCHVGG